MGPRGLSPLPNRTGAFQRIRLSSSTRLLRGGKLVDGSIHSRAHQSKHSTTCCVVSPALPENKAPLLLPSSAFPGSLVGPPFVWISPGGPSPCLSHYRKAFGYYAASVRSPARWHSRGSCEHRQCERSLISYREVRATLSMPALRRADNEVVLIGLRTQWASRRAVLARGCQPFPPSVVTTLTQIPSRGKAPFVSIGRRGSPMALSARPIRYIVSGLPTPSRATTGRRPLTPRTTTQVRLFKQLLDKRTGALLVLPHGGLNFGGEAYFRQYVLRFLLAQTHALP